MIFSTVFFDNCSLMDPFFLFCGRCSFAIKIHHSCPTSISAWYHIAVLCNAQVIYCLLFSHFYFSPVPEVLTSAADSVPGRTLTAARDTIVHSKSAWLNLFPTASPPLPVNPPVAASLILTRVASVINKTFLETKLAKPVERAAAVLASCFHGGMQQSNAGKRQSQKKKKIRDTYWEDEAGHNLLFKWFSVYQLWNKSGF